MAYGRSVFFVRGCNGLGFDVWSCSVRCCRDSLSVDGVRSALIAFGVGEFVRFLQFAGHGLTRQHDMLVSQELVYFMWGPYRGIRQFSDCMSRSFSKRKLSHTWQPLPRIMSLRNCRAWPGPESGSGFTWTRFDCFGLLNMISLYMSIKVGVFLPRSGFSRTFSTVLPGIWLRSWQSHRPTTSHEIHPFGSGVTVRSCAPCS